MTDAQIKKLFSGCTTEKAVYSRLKEYGLEYEDARAAGDCNYFNIRIPCNGCGAVRIYKAMRGGMTIQHLRPVKMEYSGIPVFFATDSLF